MRYYTKILLHENIIVTFVAFKTVVCKNMKMQFAVKWHEELAIDREREIVYRLLFIT